MKLVYADFCHILQLLVVLEMLQMQRCEDFSAEATHARFPIGMACVAV